MIKLINQNNLTYVPEKYADLIYADMVYDNLDLSWITHYWRFLKPRGIFMVQTDHHSLPEVWMYMKGLAMIFINHVVWKNEWGNYPKDRFNPCFDDILIFSKTKGHKFYPQRVQVPKATVNTRLNPSGRQTKPATAWISDICLTTTSGERIKRGDGKLLPWQKPIELMNRLLLPFTDVGDLILDPFCGSGTTLDWCYQNNRHGIGIEQNVEVYHLAKKRLKGKLDE